MKGSGIEAFTRDLGTLFSVGAIGGLSDGQLLGRFVERRESAAFEVLVHRHGPMVWGVCRRTLRDRHDAEDAFQATFLVLARKAASVLPREKLGNWLYGVAYQTARKARAMRDKRRSRESLDSDMPEPTAVPDGPKSDLTEALDRELSRIPEKYRILVILCDLEGKTHKEAARQLSWPVGTVSSRLSRARAMLARRLVRRGVALSIGTSSVLSHDVVSACVPTEVVGSTVRAAVMTAAGGALEVGMVSAKVAVLVQESLRAMQMGKLKAAFSIALILGSATTGSLAHTWGSAVEQVEKRPIPAGPATASHEGETNPKLKDDGPLNIQRPGFRGQPQPSSPEVVDKEQEELARLHGSWEVVRAVPRVDMKRLVFEREKIVVFFDGAGPNEGTVTVDPEASPAHIDIFHEADKPLSGIYELGGDTLRMCLPLPGADRPADFKAGTSATLVVLERAKAAGLAEPEGEKPPAPAPAMEQELDAPRVPFAKDYSADARAKVEAALARPDCRFLGGYYLNRWTSLRYRGDTRSLNLFLGDLAECPDAVVHVSFKRLPDGIDWRVGHKAPENRFLVEVTTNSERIDLEKLYIPQLKGGANASNLPEIPVILAPDSPRRVPH